MSMAHEHITWERSEQTRPSKRTLIEKYRWVMRPLCSDSGYPAVWNFGLICSTATPSSAPPPSNSRLISVSFAKAAANTQTPQQGNAKIIFSFLILPFFQTYRNDLFLQRQNTETDLPILNLTFVWIRPNTHIALFSFHLGSIPADFRSSNSHSLGQH